MKHSFEQQVFYSDTDAYGVVWHGSYLRWLEMGRVFFCEQMGLSLTELKEQDIVIPVTGLNVRYKASAKLDSKLRITTEIKSISPLSITFNQTILDAETDKTYIQAEIVVVAVNQDGKLYRRLPDVLKNKFKSLIIDEEQLCNV